MLSTADLGLSPDPLNPLNDVSTMNKTMEYMAFELPVVAFDLKETRVSADNAAVYVEPNDVAAYARAIAELLDDPERRRSMGAQGRQRVVDVLAWRHQAPRYVGAYERLSDELRRQRRAVVRVTETTSEPVAEHGRLPRVRFTSRRRRATRWSRRASGRRPRDVGERRPERVAWRARRGSR